MNESWDRWFLRLAETVSERSKDPSTKVGAVIARGKDFVSLGYNGLPAGVADLTERLDNEHRELKYKLIVHSEANAILKAKQDLTGCTIYVHPFPPCIRCAGLVIQSGIKHVVSWLDAYNNPRWIEDFKLAEEIYGEAGVDWYYYER